MADLIHQNYHILPIINRFGIFLGFGNKTIEQICNEKNINIDFFLEIVNVFNDKEYFPLSDSEKYSFKVLIDYLTKSHEYFLNVKLKNIEQKIDKLIDICENNSKDIKLIKNFYLEYKTELFEHIKYENETIYPYVLWLSENEGKLMKKTDKYNFRLAEYIDNHTNIEEKIFDLKNLMIKYLKLPIHIELSNEILFELFDFEKDIFDHQNLEEKILIPKAMKLEQQIFENK
ncbi:MAG: hypothetical protein U9Q83_00745 [Bacteroidota bacterium]|nr:hypothetical protein [Bacteroidota bacterium]